MQAGASLSDSAAVRPTRWLLLGGGAVTANCHLPALAALDWLHECAVVEPSPTNAAALLAEFPALNVIRSDYEAVLAEREVSESYHATLVALPNSLHAAAAEQALAAGLHVLCEKPLALDSTVCGALDLAAQRAGRKLGVAMVRRFLPSVAALRQSLQHDLIGPIRSIDFQDGGNVAHWPWDTETVLRRDQGGVLVNLGVHFLDYLELLFGDLSPAEYQDDAAGGIEVNCLYRLKSAAGVPVSVRLSWTHALANRLQVTGEKGSLVVRKDDCSACYWESAAGDVLGRLTVDHPFESGRWQPTFESCFVEQFWQFARAIQADASVIADAPAAAHTLRLIEWAYQHRSTRAGDAPPAPATRPCLSPGHAVVTGGTGFIGSALVQRLAELGFTDIAVPVRTFRTGAHIARFSAAMRRTDLLDYASVRSAVRNARYVFHLAYGTDDSAHSARITTEGSRNVVRAAIEEGVEAVVVFSTCTVYGQPNGMVTEASPHNPSLGAYGRAKSQMERGCLAAASTQSRTRIVILQPGTVYGPGGKTFTELPCRLAATGSFCWIDGGSGNLNYVYVDNLVDAALMVAEHARSGSRFIVTDGLTTWREFLEPLLAPWRDAIPNYSAEEFAALHRGVERSGFKDVVRAAVSNPALMRAISQHSVLGPLKKSLTRRMPTTHQALQSLRDKPQLILAAQPPAVPPAPWLADLYGPNSTEYSSAYMRAELAWSPAVGRSEGQTRSIEWLREIGCFER